MFLLIKEYVVGTLLVCIRSYALIMSITFIELSVGLTVIGVKNPVPIALLISIFDILPVLGTGGIMIPWIILEALTRNFTLSFALLAVYLFVTVVRNILEPKIVGTQIGLHPIVTLSSMFVGDAAVWSHRTVRLPHRLIPAALSQRKRDDPPVSQLIFS